MGAYYDEIEIEDMVWDDEKGVFHYPCPCGDRFEITRKQLANYEDIATCPSCSLIIRIVYDPLDFEDDADDDEESESDSEKTDVEEDDCSAQKEESTTNKDGEDESDADAEDDGSFEDALENLHLVSKDDVDSIGVQVKSALG